MIYTTQAGDVLDLLCYEFKNDFNEVLQANPELANHGCFLPEGVAIEFNEIKEVEPSVIESVSLWD